MVRSVTKNNRVTKNKASLFIFHLAILYTLLVSA